MKNHHFVLVMLVFTTFLNACNTSKEHAEDSDSLTTKQPAKDSKSSTKVSPYLGQKPPGLVPELFAPDIIKTEYREAAAAFTPDLKEFYFRRRGGKYKNNTLVVVQNKDNRWV